MPDVLTRLSALIENRRDGAGGASYTRQLLDGGTKRCAKKLGEEATELVIAALVEDHKAIAAESADVLYHMLVLLAERRVPLTDVLAELERRLGTSGLDEKAARVQKS
jgi:phosphoribosyl-ATP pyrophosphohydrolase